MKLTKPRAMTGDDWGRLQYEVMEAFSPGAPVDEAALFAGRPVQVDRMVEAALQRGQHAVLYGERGVGKSSLANIFSKRLSGEHRIVHSVIVNLQPGDDYTAVWRKVFRRLLDTNGVPLSDHYPEIITPDDVLMELSALPLSPMQMIFLDEYDQLQDTAARVLMANTIKDLSDRSCRVTVIIVGVADSVETLIEDHKSISRCLKQIPMPRMLPGELTEVVNSRLKLLRMGIEQEAMSFILALARGLPHYVHLLGQRASVAAIRAASLKVELKHVESALPLCVEETAQTIRTQYHAATNSPRRDNIYKEVLQAAALCDVDDLGYFQPAALCKPLATLLTKDAVPVSVFGQHLRILLTQERGQILEVTGVKHRPRYRFSNTMMQPFILMNGLQAGSITREQITALAASYYQPRLSI
ncbi:AAA family ATPase [Reyranella sp.]|uniref:AAA family ATPase n=1 Tax=Reyranella sp. TaxID=1929291 RepID=UPI003D09A695